MGTSIAFDRHKQRKPLVSNVVLGTLLFVIVEVMFFAALISAYLVIRSGAGLRWIPPGDIRLPVESTAINTFALLVSGVLMILSTKWFFKGIAKIRWIFLWSMILGTGFVVFQGQEWIKLIIQGMTMVSGVFGACFFLLIGMHGLHAVTAIIAMIYLWTKMKEGELKIEHMQAMTVYWMFIVCIWPLLYGLVYF
ncbi:COX3 domain-containing protein [Gammaproteobacteria bacterium]